MNFYIKKNKQKNLMHILHELIKQKMLSNNFIVT